MAVVKETNLRNFGVLPEVIVLQAFHEGKLMFKRSSVKDIGGFMLNLGQKLYPDDESSLEDGTGKEKINLKSISVIRRRLPENLGWPLLGKTVRLGQDDLTRSKARNMSLVEWVMNLRNRSSETTMENRNHHLDSDDENMSIDGKTEASASTFQMFCSCGSPSFDIEESSEAANHLSSDWPLLRVKTSAIGEFSGESETNNLSTQATPKSQFDYTLEEISDCKFTCLLEIILKLKSSGCRQFTYKELERATHNFSSENLIRGGGCSNVYRECICMGKLVAVKVLKPYKDAWNDFSLEVEFMCSIKHKHITNLIGACLEHEHLILVYNFLSRGSLEEMLQGDFSVRTSFDSFNNARVDYIHSQ